MEPLEISVKLSCRANEKPGTLNEETVHAKDELAVKKKKKKMPAKQNESV